MQDKTEHFKPPIFSLVIPVYNVSLYLRECIDSILNQSFQDFEIILINDGSTDDSGKICNWFISNYPNITLLNSSNSGGTASARNKGLKIAKGNYIWFVDGDDLIPENSLLLLSRLLKSEDNFSILNFTKIDFNDGDLPNLSISFDDISTKYFTSKKIILQNIPSSVCFSVYDRKFLNDEALFFDEDNQFEDEFFNLRLYTNSTFNIATTSQSFYFYRRRNVGNKTSLKDTKAIYEKCLSKIKLFKYVSQLDVTQFDDEFIRYKKRIYAEYALFFLEDYLRSQGQKKRKKLIRYFKENIPLIPIQGTYFKKSQIKRLLYNLNPYLFVVYVKLLTYLGINRIAN